MLFSYDVYYSTRVLVNGEVVVESNKIVDVCVAGETDEFTDVNYKKFNISLCQ